ncbi:tRNA-dihydrouridine synthase [Arthrobacter sp. LAPM80]|uniref:oxidoreductase n=1 Tax=Arthrobacter sp. LAPM80 TaxID=3141788 RepID=UPI00398AD265
MTRAFADAARRAVAAGFDIIKLHAAHGYLFHQLLSPLSNNRSAAYGGTLEDRARDLLETIDAVRAAVGDTVPLVVRFSPTDWVVGGWSLAETQTVARWAADHGIDLIDLSSRGTVPAPSIPAGPGYQVPFATAVRAAAGVPVVTVGLIDEPHQAEQIIGTGLADVVMAGRAFLRDPNFALHAAAALDVGLDYAPTPYHRATWLSTCWSWNF